TRAARWIARRRSSPSSIWSWLANSIIRMLFFLMIRLPPRSTLFPYTTLSDLDKIVADANVKGAVVTSGKDAFCGGADLTMLEKMGAVYAGKLKSEGEEKAAAYVFEESRKLSQLYRRIETCGKPWVCALNGTAMGGGF